MKTRNVRLRYELRCDRTPAEIWPSVSDSNRGNEIAKALGAYTAVEVTRPDGSVIRQARGHMGPLRAEWEEGFGEWVENQYWHQERHFKRGPIRSLIAEARINQDGSGSHIEYLFDASWNSLLGSILIKLGVLTRLAKKVVRGTEAAIDLLPDPDSSGTAQSVQPAHATASLKPAQQQRLDACIKEIESGSSVDGLGSRLASFLVEAPVVDLKRIRPLALARDWNAAPADVIGLCIAAKHAGMLAMRWAILCPRCRGAKSEVANLYELPKGSHCESCNIDFERDFAANVELLFQPEGWLRELPEGEFCMMGAMSTPHVKVQRVVDPGATISEPLTLPAGAYRLRTVEAGGECDVDYDGVRFPEVIVRDGGVETGKAADPGQVVLRNEADRAFNIVIEEQAWTKDALTGPQVISMPAFRELCPEQVLRPGDDVVIGQVVIMFSDLKGSTALYRKIGDGTAYGLVRDHFTFIAERVRANNGILVKTIGDAVMAAFVEPLDGLRATLSVQKDVAGFNAERGPNAISLKFGLHQGQCIAVNTNGVLDYFGTTVNVAARLQGKSRGGDIILSAEVMADPGVSTALSGAERQEETATLSGFVDAVTFYRLPDASIQNMRV